MKETAREDLEKFLCQRGIDFVGVGIGVISERGKPIEVGLVVNVLEDPSLNEMLEIRRWSIGNKTITTFRKIPNSFQPVALGTR